MDSQLPDDFAAGVLRRTTGSACDAAEPLLTAFVDGELDRSERELISGHLTHCTPCGALVAALGALGSDLRSFSEVGPDPGFVDDVLAVTCDALPVRTPRATEWGERLRVLVLRPRFSMEAAFAGSILFTLLFGVLEPRLGASPPAALAEGIRAGVQERLATVRRVWDQAADPVAGSLEATGRVLLRTARSLARPPGEAAPSDPPSAGDNPHATDSSGENR